MQEEMPLDSLTNLPPGDYGALFAKMFLTLISLVLLLAITFWILKQWMQKRLQKGTGTQSIQVLEKRMISPKTMLYLLSIDDKKVLIAESHLEVRRLDTASFEEKIDPPSPELR